MRKADYSKLAAAYDSSRLAIDFRADVWLNALLERMKIEDGGRVLEVGCGTGRWTLALADRCRMVGMDPSRHMLAEAVGKPGAEAVDWVEGAAPYFPFADGVFSRVLFILVIHHIDDQDSALEETFRVLQPGGWVVIRTCGHDYIRQYPLGEYFPGYREVELHSFPEVGLLMERMRGIGFDPVDSVSVRQEVTYGVEDYLRRVRNRFISTLDRIGEENFRVGYERLCADLEGKPSCTYTIEHEFVRGVKPR